MTTCIVWFRNDLRLHDNEVINKAVSEYDFVVPVYIIDIEYLKRSSFGFRKIGTRRMKFILQCIEELNKSLNELKSRLLVFIGKPEELLPGLARKYHASGILAHKEIASEEIASERAVMNALDGLVELRLIWGSTLFHIDDLPFEEGKLPDVFTEFRKKVEVQSAIRPEFKGPTAIPFPERDTQNESFFGAIPKPDELGFEDLEILPEYGFSFIGGEHEAWKRLNYYFFQTHSLSAYKETRNGLLGQDYSSKFSPWLAQGCISPKAIYFEVKRFEKEIKMNDSTYWLVFELIWRDYFKFVLLKYGNELFKPGGIQNRKPDIVENTQWLHAWKDGNTGIPFIDANMRELKQTGFMSNRGRQNVASFLVNDLKQDWRAGAAWFEQELIDYDVASNWGNWAYIAGVGNDPRHDRYFNIIVQAERYDVEGNYVKHWLPQLACLPQKTVHMPWMQNKEALEKNDLADAPYAFPVMVPERWNL